MSKGFIFTIDSVLALLVATFLAVSAVSFSSHFTDSLDKSAALGETGRDFLSALERNGTLERAAQAGSSDGLVQSLDALPLSYCASLQLFDNSTIAMQANRTGCACGAESVVLYRTFLALNGSAQREMYARFGGCFD